NGGNECRNLIDRGVRCVRRSKGTINDVRFRDGMHAIRHQHWTEQIAEQTKVSDDAGTDSIEAAHGDGLGESCIEYGASKETEEGMIKTAVENAKNAKIAVLLLPGIGTIQHLERARDWGAQVVRIATHCTEADVSEQHIKKAVELGMDTVGFLM